MLVIINNIATFIGFILVIIYFILLVKEYSKIIKF